MDDNMTMNEISCDLICMCFRIYPHEFWIKCIAVSSSPTPALKVLTVESIYRSWTERWRPVSTGWNVLAEERSSMSAYHSFARTPGSIFITTPAFSPLYHAYYSSQCFAHLVLLHFANTHGTIRFNLIMRFVFICFHSSTSLLTLRPLPIPPILKTDITTHRFPLCSAFPALVFLNFRKHSTHIITWDELSYQLSRTLIP